LTNPPERAAAPNVTGALAGARSPAAPLAAKLAIAGVATLEDAVREVRSDVVPGTTVGQVPRTSVMPTAETIADATESCLHSSPGRRTPQKDIAAATNPIADTTQKTPATTVDADGARDGKSQNRAVAHRPVS